MQCSYCKEPLGTNENIRLGDSGELYHRICSDYLASVEEAPAFVPKRSSPIKNRNNNAAEEVVVPPAPSLPRHETILEEPAEPAQRVVKEVQFAEETARPPSAAPPAAGGDFEVSASGSLIGEYRAKIRELTERYNDAAKLYNKQSEKMSELAQEYAEALYLNEILIKKVRKYKEKFYSLKEGMVGKKPASKPREDPPAKPKPEKEEKPVEKHRTKERKHEGRKKQEKKESTRHRSLSKSHVRSKEMKKSRKSERSASRKREAHAKKAGDENDNNAVRRREKEKYQKRIKRVSSDLGLRVKSEKRKEKTEKGRRESKRRSSHK